MKADENEILIDTNHLKNEDNLKEKNIDENPPIANIYCDTLSIRSKIFLLNFVYYFFSSFSTNIILFFVNKKYPDSTKYIDSIGASQSFMNYAVYPIILGCSSVIEVIGTQSYGAEKFKLFGYYLHRARIIGIIGLGIFSILVVCNSNYIFDFFGFDQISQKMLRNILCFRILASFLIWNTIFFLDFSR